jgi:hypothetical protein
MDMPVNKAKIRHERQNATSTKRMATVPLQAAFRGDFATLLVLVDDEDTMEVVAQKVAYHVIGRRLPPQDAPNARAT